MKKITLITIIAFFISSCATIIQGSKKKITFTSTPSGAKFFINDSLYGVTPYVCKLKRNKTNSIRYELKDYTNKYGVIYGDRTSGLEILSYFFAFYPSLVDMATGSCIIPNLTDANLTLEKLPIRNKKSNYLKIDKISCSIPKKQDIAKVYQNGFYFKRNKRSENVKFEDSFLQNYEFISEPITDFLVKTNYADTTNTLFKNYLLLSCNINNVEIISAVSTFINYKTDLTWKIFDQYNNEVYKKNIVDKSDNYSYEEKPINSLGEAIKENLSVLLSDVKFQEVITDKSDNLKKNIANFSTINIKKRILSKEESTVSTAIKSVVSIKLKDGHGSGCIISEDGYIVTNLHVTGTKDTVDVIFNDEKTLKGIVVRKNELLDLALIKVKTTNLIPLNLNLSETINVGDEVYAIGTPADIELGQTISKGIISGARKFGEKKYIQTDVSINSGSSGGALVDKQGVLNGITNAKLVGKGIEGIGFAIPAYLILDGLKIKYTN